MGGVAVGISVIAGFATLRTLGWGFRDGQVQIGLLNMCDRGGLPASPLFNMGW